MSEIVILGLWLGGALGLGLWCVPRGSDDAAGPGWVRLPLAILAGIALQTLLSGLAYWAGCSPRQVFVGMEAIGGASLAGWLVVHRRGLRLGSLPRLRWYEWLVVLLLCEKAAFGIWQIATLPTMFEDPVFHWSGRGRQLFGGVNWSWQPGDRFLGLVAWNRHYPLLIPMLRATLCGGAGGWSDSLSRADGLVWFLVIASLVWWMPLRAGAHRLWGSVAVGLWLTQPLLTWHLGGGDADLAVSAFAFGALAALTQRWWSLAGLLMAGAAMTKNEGLVIYGVALGVAALLPSPGESATRRETQGRALRLGAGLLALAPWLLFRTIHRMGISPAGEPMAFHPEAIPTVAQGLWPNSSSQIHWLVALLVLAASSVRLWRHPVGRIVATMFAFSFAGFVGVFVVSDASRWLANDVTLYRVLLQLSPMAFSAAAIGAGLFWTLEAEPLARRNVSTENPETFQHG